MPIMTTVMTSMRLRPRRSPKCPNTTPPSGRNRKPTPKVPNAASVPSVGLSAGKNCVLNTSAAVMPYNKKSYQSTTAPTKLASAALRAWSFCFIFTSGAMTSCMLRYPFSLCCSICSGGPDAAGSSAVVQRLRQKQLTLHVVVCRILLARPGQAADPHAQQPDALFQRHAAQAFAGSLPDGRGISRRGRQRRVARDGGEIGIAQLDADRFPEVAFAMQVFRHAGAQRGKDTGQGLPVMAGMQVALEGGLATDRFGFGTGRHGALVDAVRDLAQPVRIAAPEMVLQQTRIRPGEVADGEDAERVELFSRLGADAVDLARRQRPYARRQVCHVDDGQAVGFFQIGADFRQQLVGGNAD